MAQIYPNSLTAEEEVILSRRWLTQRDPKAAERIVKAFQPLVRAQARRFLNQALLFDDLVGEGNLGLMRALDKFDPERGVRFATYATWWVRAALLDHVLFAGRHQGRTDAGTFGPPAPRTGAGSGTSP